MNPPPWADLLLVNLRWGRDGARTLGELAEAMGAPRRALEKAVEELRKAGSPIVTGSDGVWLSVSDVELEAAAKALQERAVTILLGARALRKTARRFAKVKQLGMWDAA